MEANMSYLKRRLNRAMVECKSQASFTARRLVGQIRTMESQATTKMMTKSNQRSRGQTGATLVALPPTMISSKHLLQRRHNNHFSYTFSPNSSALEQTTDNVMEEHYLEEVEFEEGEDRKNSGESGCEGDGNCNVSIATEHGRRVGVGQDHGRGRRQRQQKQCHPEHHQKHVGQLRLTEGQDCCLVNFEGQNNSSEDLKISNNKDIDDQQQIKEFSSEENDINSSSSSLNNTQQQMNKMWKITRKNNSKKLQAYQLSSKLSPISLKSASKLSSPSQQHFVRCSTINVGFKTRSSVRRSKRGSKRNQRRQVRFEPTPQSINISATTIESVENSFKQTSQTSSDSSEENLSTSENDSSITPTKTKASDVQQQVFQKEPKPTCFYKNSNVERRKIRKYLSAAKPFTKKLHHLSHNIKFNKIKLKSFNNLAHQLHQTLSNSTNNFAPDHHPNQNTSNKLRKLSKPANQQQTSSSYCISSQTNSRNYSNSGQADCDDEDFGWGSDFDEHESVDSSLSSQQQQEFKDQSMTSNRGGGGAGGTSGGYLLEIGKSSCDFRAIEDVIQDQGTSGQFKRLDLSQYHEDSFKPGSSSPAGLDELIVDEAEQSEGEKEKEKRASKEDVEDIGDDQEEEDDEAELRSLEARQGFKQIRDKLKIILDQRLANYEKSAVQIATTTTTTTTSEVGVSMKSTTTSNSSSKVSFDAANKDAISRRESKLMIMNENVEHLSNTRTSKTNPSNSASSLKIVTSSPTSDVTTSIDSSSTTTRSASISPTLTLTLTSSPSSTVTAKATTTSATPTPTTASASTPPASGGCNEFEDCQSHCSDESSSSSVGLDSNHSSGQDSGHSTQHSGYSAASSAMHRQHNPRGHHDCHDNHQCEHHHNHHTHSHHHHHHHHRHAVCSVNHEDTRGTGVGESSPIQPGTLSVSQSCDTRNDKSPVASTPPLSSSAYSSSSSPSQMIISKDDANMDHLPSKSQLESNEDKANLLEASDETIEERRNRFLQNRLIINSKLESMFKSRSNGNLSTLQPKQSSPEVEKQEQASERKQHRVKQLQQHQLDKVSLAIGDLPNASNNIDSETRIKLLEQQRQISLKLKQKPRRKSAKRAFMVHSQGLDSNTEEDSGSYLSSNPSERLKNFNKVVIPTNCTGTIRHNNYESLTKQLSMICLRQAGSQLAVFQNNQKPLDKHHLGRSSYATSDNWNEVGKVDMPIVAGSSRHVGPNFNTLNSSNQQQPKAAMSLRQLVKDVIDDCERPSKLSSLTISILNRSDSFSSDLANLSADEGDILTPPQQAAKLNDNNHVDNRLEEERLPFDGDDSMTRLNHRVTRSQFYRNHRYQNHIYASPTSSLSLSSLPAATATRVRSSSPVADQANTEENKSSANRAMALEPICYMVHPIPLPTISMESTLSHHNHHYQHQYNNNDQQQQMATADQSISSIGTIDGLEYSRASSGYSNSELCLQSHNNNVGETAGAISNGFSSNVNATIGFGKMQKSTIGSYLKSLRELSRFKKLPKVKLITNGGNTNKQSVLNQQVEDNHHSGQQQVTSIASFANKTTTPTVGHHNKLPPSSYCEFYNDVNFY